MFGTHLDEVFGALRHKVVTVVAALRTDSVDRADHQSRSRQRT
ncbi:MULTISPECIES: hypothetical protein [unclassified Rhodococcus (in: high G+C Gram-positive bacteria)]|nr:MULTISPECIES: hypothetical protein [unclassified Rhodococcus (in: high G+C Gram-positive bacteria)]